MATAVEQLRLERAAAWGEYLASTRGQFDFRYEQVEPWAWSILQSRLTAIGARERALRDQVREDDGA